MDPIIKEAMKRTSQMQGNIKNNQTAKPFPKVTESEKPQITEQNILKQDNGMELLFKDKEQSLIMLLLILLMNEDSDPSLMLALLYLLI